MSSLEMVCPARFIPALVLLCLTAFVQSGHSQSVLYDNGPDAETGYYQVNFGASTADSFILPHAAAVSNFALTLYCVDDRNWPQQIRWTITTQPYGGTVLGTGVTPLNRLQPPYLTRFLFFAWDVGFQIPPLDLPAGTYWIQLQNVNTRWLTLAYWAEGTGTSMAYYDPAGSGTNGAVQRAASESFSVMGAWANAAP